MEARIRRKNYFMPKSFQGKYIFYFFLISVFCVFLFSVIFSYMAAGSTSIVYDKYNFRVGATPAILIKQILLSNWAFILFGGVVTSLVTMLLMHRITGPLYRFDMALDKMLNGDFTGRITLRKYDEGKDIAVKFNEINDLLSLKINDIIKLNESSEKNIGILQAKYKGDNDVDKLAGDLNQIMLKLRQFKID